MQLKVSSPAALTVLSLLAVVGCAACERDSAPQLVTDCVVLDNPLQGGGESFIIEKSGRYCLGKDMSTRLDFADHREQPFLISIRADNVDLDLRGHTLNRGWNRKPPGLRGIEITEPVGKRMGEPGAKNIRIHNGHLHGFGTGIGGRLECQLDCNNVAITYDVASDTYHYAPDNVTVQGVEFKDVLNKIFFSDGLGHRVVAAGDRR